MKTWRPRPSSAARLFTFSASQSTTACWGSGTAKVPASTAPAAAGGGIAVGSAGSDPWWNEGFRFPDQGFDLEAAIVTNVEEDHLGHWQTMDRLEAAFAVFDQEWRRGLTDEQIEAARQEAAFEATAIPLDKLTKAEAAEYSKLVEDAKTEAEERVRTEAMREIVRDPITLAIAILLPVAMMLGIPKNI